MFAIVALTTSIFIFSCSKQAKQNEEMTLEDQMKKLGENHNKLVTGSYEYAIKMRNSRNLNARELVNPEVVKEDILNYFKSQNFDPSALNLTTQQFWTNTENMISTLGDYNYDYKDLPQKSGSAVCIPYFERILEIVNENSTIADIQNSLDAYVVDVVEKELTGNDLQAVLGTISITKSSTYLWFPEELGGYDLLTKTFGRPDNSMGKMSWWKRAIVGDASASAQYFLGIGVGGAISAAFVPGTNAVLFGGWAITAGIGSACGALGL